MHSFSKEGFEIMEFDELDHCVDEDGEGGRQWGADMCFPGVSRTDARPWLY